jgi:hypothetical protein
MAELAPVHFSLVFRTGCAMRVPACDDAGANRQMVRGSLIGACGGEALEQVVRHHYIIHVAEAVLQLSERVKIGPLNASSGKGIERTPRCTAAS